MGLLDALGRFLALEPLQARTVNPTPYSSFETQLAAIRRDVAAPWTPATIADALSVPAIHRAVTLIANTVGTLSLEAWMSGALIDQADTPRILVRPNPFTTPFEFFRDWAYSLATRGEAWHWIAARDGYGTPLSLYPMPAQEVFVTINDRDLLRPDIRWRDQKMPNEDVVQTIQSREPGDLRGSGPLQRCGAAVSVAVESAEWAANFFGGGGLPSILIKSAVALTETEAQALKTQWYETPSNVPRVIDPGIEDVKDFSIDPAKAQLTDTRRYSKGEAALMFGIPGALMDYHEPGSSLTYANVTMIYDQFLKACLLPYYLAPIEQAMSDLLTRSTTAKFNVDGLLRADIKTRYDVYTAGITAGVLTTDEARIAEGLAPGSIETAPVPMSPPSAVPSQLPIQRTAMAVRCDGQLVIRGVLRRCNRLLAESGPFVGTCPRCKKEHARVA